MESYKIEFIKFALSRNVLKFGEFALKSGRKSPYFFNAGLFSTGADLARLGEFYAKAIQSSAVDFDVIFGPAYKGIPIATSVSIALFNQFNRDTPVCFNRKEAKDHGEGGTIVGAPLKGKVIVIDDVISAGTSVRESVKLIEAAGATPSGVLIALDRMEKGGNAEVMTEVSAVQDVRDTFKMPVVSIINLNDLLAFMDEDTPMAQQARPFKDAVIAYRNRYGA